MADSISINTLTVLAGHWQREADSGAGSHERRMVLRECADTLRMLCETVFDRVELVPPKERQEREAKPYGYIERAKLEDRSPAQIIFKDAAMNADSVPLYLAPPKDGQAELLETRRHEANEWADMACNAVQWIKNIRDGVSTTEDALNNLAENLKHCREVSCKAAAAIASHTQQQKQGELR